MRGKYSGGARVEVRRLRTALTVMAQTCENLMGDASPALLEAL